MTLRPILLSLCFAVFSLGAATHAANIPIDFSTAGYGGGGVPIPSVSAKIAIGPSGADDTAAIQAEIENISALPPDASGFRGAIVLRAGQYHLAGQLRIAKSGIVLRGENATLIATGQSRRALIDIRGNDADEKLGPARPLAADVPVGSTNLTLAKLDGLAVGTRVVIRRPSTKEWIHDLGMDQFTGSFKDIRLTWLPGSRDLVWDRTITSVDAATRSVTLDAPITTALEARYGGATVQAISPTSQLRQIGIERLTLRSEFDPTNPRDEEHAWIAIQLERVENAWVRDVTATHFVSAAVWLGTETKAITIQDCLSESPVGEDAGWRRFGFYVGGQQILVQRCTALEARQPFLAGQCSAGPNVFLDCAATRATGDSGSIESWASGVLFDSVKIDGGDLVLGNLGARWQGAGWNAANSIAWNCTAKKVVMGKNSGASQRTLGAVLRNDSNAPSTDELASTTNHVETIAAENPPGATNQAITDPAQLPLYRGQLAARSGEKSLEALNADNQKPEASGGKPVIFSPPTSALRHRTSGVCTSVINPLTITNGHFTIGNKTIFGSATSNAWWKGQTIPVRAEELGWSATRWAPGRTGPGLTEDIAALATKLAASGNVLVQVWPGLWYDRRRDAHLVAAQPDSETWAPFYEQPWARSGQGRATDGLSKYDLTKFNPWYWSRLHELAAECAKHEMVLYHHFYNHHNLVETAAHWADFPWRPANCLQATGFPEPPPYETVGAGKRIGIVGQFYDISDPVRRELHRLFIWHGLDALADCPNVVHTLGFQFAGPLSFQQFFLDTVAEWETTRGQHVHLALATSKAVTDAILADPARAPLVDVIDQRNWQYLADGSLFAPDSGGKLAFREQRTTAFGKDAVPPSTPELVYKQVREYRDRFQGKAIVCSHAGQGPIPILMAGGALPLLADYSSSQPLKLDRDDHAFILFVREHLASALSQMHPAHSAPGVWCLADDEGDNRLYYSPTGEQLAIGQPVDFKNSTSFWFDPQTGITQPAQLKDGPAIAKPSPAAWLLLIQRKR